MNNQNLLGRRELLKIAIAGAAAASLPGLAGAAPRQGAGKVIVGGHPWVYAAKLPRYDITPRLDEIFADMKYAGLDGIELMNVALEPDDAVARIGKLIEKHGLPVIGCSFGGAMWDRGQQDAVLKQVGTIIPRLAKLGGRTFGLSVGSAGGKNLKTPAQLDQQALVLRRIFAICADHGVTANLHNHTYEVQNGLHDLKGTLARIPDAKLGPDLNWLVRGGVDPVEFIRQYGKQIVFLHLRDQKADGKWPEAVGEGAMDYAAIGKALHDVNFQGPAVIELAYESTFTPTRPIRETFKMSRAYVRKTMGY